MATKPAINNQEDYASIMNRLEKPILFVDTTVGHGNVSVADALLETFEDKEQIYRMHIEDLVTKKIVNEDYKRYKFISNNIPFLLNLIYRIPLFYYRKMIREQMSGSENTQKIKEVLERLDIKTVVCISHRPAFWLSCLKKREKMSFNLWGVATEFGRTLAWKYIFWDEMDGYITSIPKELFDYRFRGGMEYHMIKPPCRRIYKQISNEKGDTNTTLFIAGFWGQIFPEKAKKIIRDIITRLPGLNMMVVCGTNARLLESLRMEFENKDGIKIYGQVEDMDRLFKKCASVITKPGFSTLVEANNSGRQIFLLRGMPVAEDHNAKYAIENYKARRFTVDEFVKWHINHKK